MMIVYSATKQQFVNDVRSNAIADIIENEVSRKLNRNSPKNEFISWKNSVQYMFNVLHDDDIPASAGVSIEYNIPLTNRRVDFILTGKDANRRDTAVIVELKQWQEVEVTRKDAIVKTRFQHGEKETNHQSYQAWSYLDGDTLAELMIDNSLGVATKHIVEITALDTDYFTED